MSTMDITAKDKKSKVPKKVKGPMDNFIRNQQVLEDSLTLSDFDCDTTDLDLSSIVNRIIS